MRYRCEYTGLVLLHGVAASVEMTSQKKVQTKKFDVDEAVEQLKREKKKQ